MFTPQNLPVSRNTPLPLPLPSFPFCNLYFGCNMYSIIPADCTSSILLISKYYGIFSDEAFINVKGGLFWCFSVQPYRSWTPPRGRHKLGSLSPFRRDVRALACHTVENRRWRKRNIEELLRRGKERPRTIRSIRRIQGKWNRTHREFNKKLMIPSHFSNFETNHFFEGSTFHLGIENTT